LVSLADNERGLADAYKNAVHIAERDRSRAARPLLPKKSTFFRPILRLTLAQVNLVRRPVSAACSTAAITRCSATASSKLGAVWVPSCRSLAILA